MSKHDGVFTSISAEELDYRLKLDELNKELKSVNDLHFKCNKNIALSFGEVVNDFDVNTKTKSLFESLKNPTLTVFEKKDLLNKIQEIINFKKIVIKVRSEGIIEKYERSYKSEIESFLTSEDENFKKNQSLHREQFSEIRKLFSEINEEKKHNIGI